MHAGSLSLLPPNGEEARRQCNALERLVLWLGQCEPNAQTCRATTELLNYFDAAVPAVNDRTLEALWQALRPEILSIAKGEQLPAVVSHAQAFVRMARRRLTLPVQWDAPALFAHGSTLRETF
ncbi:MAG: hypothetical protein V4684_03130 [Pseudomonadota bacterium]